MVCALIFGSNLKKDLIFNKSEVNFHFISSFKLSHQIIFIIIYYFYFYNVLIKRKEFYAATEGNTSLFNFKDKTGAVGYIPPILYGFYPVKLIKLHDDNEVPFLLLFILLNIIVENYIINYIISSGK